MRSYTLPSDVNYGRLPKLVVGTTSLLAMPRPNAPVAAVISPFDRVYPTVNIGTGKVAAQVNILTGYYHVILARGLQATIDPRDVRGQDETPEARPDCSYRIVDLCPATDSGMRALMKAWLDDPKAPAALQRILPATVIGQVAPDAEPGRLHDETTGTVWRVDPGDWIVRDHTNRNPFVATTKQLGRGFASLSFGSGDYMVL